MSKIGLIAATICLATAGGASAQSFYGYNFHSTETTPWAGPYVGFHGGYALDEDNTTRITGGSAVNQANIAGNLRPRSLIRDKDGYVAGGQIGWNLQAKRIVVGVEGDYSLTDLSTHAGVVGQSGALSSVGARNNYLATVRGRAGYVMPGGVLLYGTGGYATTEIKDAALFRNAQGVNAFQGAHEYQTSGLVYGAGVEYALPATVLNRFGGLLSNSKVTTRLEWLHYGFDNKSINVAAIGGVTGAAGGYNARFDNKIDVIRAGFNFKL